MDPQDVGVGVARDDHVMGRKRRLAGAKREQEVYDRTRNGSIEPLEG